MGQGIAACIEAYPTGSMVVGVIVATVLILLLIDSRVNRYREEKGHE